MVSSWRCEGCLPTIMRWNWSKVSGNRVERKWRKEDWDATVQSGSMVPLVTAYPALPAYYRWVLYYLFPYLFFIHSLPTPYRELSARVDKACNNARQAIPKPTMHKACVTGYQGAFKYVSSVNDEQVRRVRVLSYGHVCVSVFFLMFSP